VQEPGGREECASFIFMRLLGSRRRAKRCSVPFRMVVHMVVQWTVQWFCERGPVQEVPLEGASSSASTAG
jgi:hypothetical protein